MLEHYPCIALNMSNDVAGATFMAAATSAPELFVNVIGTFITEGDIGVGTIVGSAVFNILAVAACCGIGAGMVTHGTLYSSFVQISYTSFFEPPFVDHTIGLVAFDPRQYCIRHYRGHPDWFYARRTCGVV